MAREEAIEMLKKDKEQRGNCFISDAIDMAIKALEQEPKTGHWNCGDDMFEYAICSSCKHETGEAWEYAKRNFKFCPNCGAKMERDDKK